MGDLQTSAVADLVGQHHNDPSWPPNQRLVVRMVRVLGRDPVTLDWLIQDGRTVPGLPSTLGDLNCFGVWLPSDEADPSGTVRAVPLWADAYPALVEPPSGGTQGADPYRTKVQGTTRAIPAFDQDPQDALSWRRDTGLLAQRVALYGLDGLPGDFPVVTLPLSITTEQQTAAVPGTNALVAVWHGGAKNGRFGTPVYDVTADGRLDKVRRARDHSSWIVYRLPLAGLLPFGGVADPGAAGKTPPLSGGLAWIQCLDVEGQAGYGMIADTVATAAVVPTPDPEPTSGGGGVHATTQSRPQGQSPSTQGFPPLPGQKPQTVFGVTGKKGFGPFSVGTTNDKHHIADTPDHEIVNCTHWNVLTPIDGDGFDAPAETAGVYKPTMPGGPLIVPVFWRYDPNSVHQFLGGIKQGLRRWEVNVGFDTPTTQKPPPDDVTTGPSEQFRSRPGTYADPFKAPNADGVLTSPAADGLLPQKPATDPIKQDVGKAPSADGHAIKQDVTKTGDSIKRDVVKTPDERTHRIKQDVVKNVVADLIDQELIQGEEFQQGFQTLGGGQASAEPTFTSGPSITLAGGADPQPVAGSDNPIGTDRGYVRTPLELATPGLLGRPPRSKGPDNRGRTGALSAAGLAAYNSAVPVSASFAAVSSHQAEGSWEYLAGAGPGVGLYSGGAANAGGFALTPASVDALTVVENTVAQNNILNASTLGDTFLWHSTFATQTAWADPTPGGLARDGYTFGRGTNTSASLDWVDSNARAGGATELPSALFVDSGQSVIDPPPSFQAWGGQVVTVWNTTNGQAPAGTVFVADGTNTAPGGTWQTVSGSGLPTGFVRNLQLVWVDTTHITTKAGKARSSSDVADITLGSDTSVATTSGGAGGVDYVAGPTASATAASTTATLNADLRTYLIFRAGTGTISSTGTAVTGTGTQFLSETAVGDLVGDVGPSGASTSSGWARVASIADDTHLTLVVALPGGNIAGGSAFGIVENATFSLNATGYKCRRVSSLSANGLTLVGEASWSGSTQTNVATRVGELSVNSVTGIVAFWAFVWVGAGGTGTTAFFSTQRTTPFTIAGYTTSVRRVGALPINPNGNAVFTDAFEQDGNASERRYVSQSPNVNSVVNNTGLQAAFTAVYCGDYVPPTSTRMLGTVRLVGTTSAVSIVYFRPRGLGQTSAQRPQFFEEQGQQNGGGTFGEACGAIDLGVDGAQYYDYVNVGGAPQNYFNVVGYVEYL